MARSVEQPYNSAITFEDKMKTTRREALLGAATFAAAVAIPFERSFASVMEETKEKPATNLALADAVSLSDFEEIARNRMSHMAWEYINSGAADQITLKWNREALDRIRLNPHVLRDTSNLNTRIKVLGQELPFPIMVSPTALHQLAHPEGELATARGVGNAEATMILSTMSSTTLEDVAKAATKPLWFQLYVQKDRGFTENLIARAEALKKIYYSPCLYIYPIYSVVKHHPRLQFAAWPHSAAVNISSSPCARVKPLAVQCSKPSSQPSAFSLAWFSTLNNHFLRVVTPREAACRGAL
jgi:hypothetical protein